jgi:ArsR family transcriptional regulator
MVQLDLLLSALSHPTRRCALRLLSQYDELCLCDLMASIGVGQSSMSRHMAVLKEAGLVAGRRDAQWVRYRRELIADSGMARVVSAVLDLAEDRTADFEARSAA